MYIEEETHERSALHFRHCTTSRLTPDDFVKIFAFVSLLSILVYMFALPLTLFPYDD